MAQASPADLNAYAAVAQDYDEIAFHTEDPGTSLTDFLADGGGPYALTMALAGEAGPTPSAQPATDGRTYADAPVMAVLNERAEWVSLRSGGVLRRVFRMPRGAIGPGTYPLVYGLAVGVKS